jgi:hypothetical protein
MAGSKQRKTCSPAGEQAWDGRDGWSDQKRPLMPKLTRVP